ncbi:hypothetical protein PG994_008133 [Apiospora phragmitis]|uniref:Rhodopsin domain-containing protein n=1 Tax=Apiospora phragmitis TaxID=2905665 RepID=A0ABR1US86_9PEZI
MAQNVTPAFPPGYAEETIGPRVVAIAITFIILQIVVVALRFGTRIVYKTQWGLDDYLTPPALLTSLGMCVLAIVEVNIAGVGKHLAPLYFTDPQAVINWAKCGIAIECIGCAAVAFPKLSILASFLRIFTTKAYRVPTYILILIPLFRALGPRLVHHQLYRCASVLGRGSVPNVVTDVVMIILPLPVVWRLHIDYKQKFALTGVFLLGGL